MCLFVVLFSWAEQLSCLLTKNNLAKNYFFDEMCDITVFTCVRQKCPLRKIILQEDTTASKANIFFGSCVFLIQ